MQPLNIFMYVCVCVYVCIYMYIYMNINYSLTRKAPLVSEKVRLQNNILSVSSLKFQNTYMHIEG